jgi:hypothetical protein
MKPGNSRKQNIRTTEQQKAEHQNIRRTERQNDRKKRNPKQNGLGSRASETPKFPQNKKVRSWELLNF